MKEDDAYKEHILKDDSIIIENPTKMNRLLPFDPNCEVSANFLKQKRFDWKLIVFKIIVMLVAILFLVGLSVVVSIFCPDLILGVLIIGFLVGSVIDQILFD